jgi:hypothetical protein
MSRQTIAYKPLPTPLIRTWASGTPRSAAHNLINRAAIALITFHDELFSVHAVALHANVARLTACSAVFYRNWPTEGFNKSAERKVITDLGIHLSSRKRHDHLLYGTTFTNSGVVVTGGVIFSNADATA